MKKLKQVIFLLTVLAMFLIAGGMDCGEISFGAAMAASAFNFILMAWSGFSSGLLATFDEKEKLENAIAKLAEQVEDFQRQIESVKSTKDRAVQRLKKGEKYFYVDFSFGNAIVKEVAERITMADYTLFDNNDYFLEEKYAQEIADKFNLFLRINRLHDELCPDFVIESDPLKMKDGQAYYIISFSGIYKKYTYCVLTKDNLVSLGYPLFDVFFRDEKTVQTACDILNEELEQTK